jgi:hypothetical protein
MMTAEEVSGARAPSSTSPFPHPPPPTHPKHAARMHNAGACMVSVPVRGVGELEYARRPVFCTFLINFTVEILHPSLAPRHGTP